MKAADRIARLKEKAKREPLVVLVWGPGEPALNAGDEARKYWQKRLRIKEVLESEFSNSEVFFSESEALRDHTRTLEDVLTEELVHASVADCILVLDVSRGASVEVDRFSCHPLIASKMRLLIPDRYVGTTGLVGVVHKGLRIYGFSSSDLEECKVAAEKSVAIVLSVALEKMMKRSELFS